MEFISAYCRRQGSDTSAECDFKDLLTPTIKRKFYPEEFEYPELF